MSKPRVQEEPKTGRTWVVFDDLIDGYEVSLWLAWSGGQSQVAAVRIDPANEDDTTPHGGLTASLVRSSLALRSLHLAAEEAVRASLPEPVRAALNLPILPENRKRVRIRDDRFYARVAAEYVRAATEKSWDVYGEIANRLHFSKSYCRDLAKGAVERGLLVRTRGRTGGHLTDKAIEILKVQIASTAAAASSMSANLDVRTPKET